MRSVYLFVALVGVMPLMAFASTVWLTDGAPFAPFGSHDAARGETARGSGRSSADPALKTLPSYVEGNAIAGHNDSGLSRLRRLARAGDAEAALLLAILEEPGGHAPHR